MPKGGCVHTMLCPNLLTSLTVFIIAIVSKVMGLLCERQIVETPGHLMLSDHRNSIKFTSHKHTHICARGVSVICCSSSEVGTRGNGPSGGLPLRCVADIYHSCQPLVWNTGKKYHCQLVHWEEVVQLSCVVKALACPLQLPNIDPGQCIPK